MADDNTGPRVKRLGHLLPKNCALLVCDLQEKFRPAILHFDEIVKNTNRLGKAQEIVIC